MRVHVDADQAFAGFPVTTKKIIFHPFFNFSTISDYDLALIILSKPIYKEKQIGLFWKGTDFDPSLGLKNCDSLYVAGYGENTLGN